ncbi:MAG: flippase-like domain-containing protein [Actinomycetota bacterium]|nr:flippase-like domain-containing protein [Actinomycetota bacterium]
MDKPRLSRPLKRALTALAIALVVEYLVLPQIAGVRKSLSLLGDLNLGLVLLGFLVEGCALVAYAKLTEAVIPADGRPPLFTILRIDLSTLAVSHLLPGGAAAGTGLGYRLMTENGISGSDAGFALAAQGVGSAVVLNVLLWLGLVVSIPVRGFNPLYGTAALVGAILIGALALAVFTLTRGEERAAQIVCRAASRLPVLDEEAIEAGVHRVAARLRALLQDRHVAGRAILWASANWVLDAASLWVFVAAFGHRVGIDGLIVSYGLANVLAAIPLTPGGLGVVEAMLTSSLVGFGTPRGIAILGVVAYRLVNFWLPIPVGGLATLSLRVGRGAPRDVKRAELDRLARESAAETEDARSWASRHGLRVSKTTRRST